MSRFGLVRSLIAFAAFTVFALTPNTAFGQRGGHGGGGGGSHGGGGGGAASTAAVGVVAFMGGGGGGFHSGVGFLAEEDSHSGVEAVLPVAVAGRLPLVAEDIVVAAPTGACGPTVAAAIFWWRKL